ncbi:MAG: hypothetical protein ACRELA_00060 [Candidatus Rokuibacteriota bacterium]
MQANSPDRAYLDAFLQGARFSLFAMEGTLREKHSMTQEEMREVIAGLHELFQTTRVGLRERWAIVRVDGDPRKKN